MDRRKYTYYQAVIGAFVGALIGWSVVTGNVVLSVIAIVVGMTANHLCRRRVTEVMEDEMILRISERASRRSLQAFIAVAGVTGALLVTLRSVEYVELVQAGYALAFSACALLILYLIFYWYYSRKGLD